MINKRRPQNINTLHCCGVETVMVRYKERKSIMSESKQIRRKLDAEYEEQERILIEQMELTSDQGYAFFDGNFGTIKSQDYYEDNNTVTYDIWVEEKNLLYKHIDAEKVILLPDFLVEDILNLRSEKDTNEVTDINWKEMMDTDLNSCIGILTLNQIEQLREFYCKEK
jgi:hypothetical protein